MTIGSTQDERDRGRGTAPASGPRRASGPFRSPGLLAAAGHRWPTLLALALAVVTFADGLPALEFLAALLVVMPLCYLLFGALRGELRPPRVLVLQIAGLLGFAAVALTALAVDETLGLHVLAAGWLAHAVWDFAHHRTGRVVPRAWAEWCCVVDACGALALALLAQ